MRAMLITMVALIAEITGTSTMAQADGLVAYVPERPVERTADDTRIGFSAGAVAGTIEAMLPADADRVDVLNSRGNVKYAYSIAEFEQVGLGGLGAGTWTLRVHRAGTMAVRRFVVMERGTVIWSPERPKRGRRLSVKP